MRAWNGAVAALTALAGMLLADAQSLAQSQIDRSNFSYGGFRGDAFQTPIRGGQGHSHRHGHHHHGHGHWHGGYGYGGLYFGGPGYGFNHYYGPWINPPVFVAPQIGFGWGGAYGYGSAWAPPIVDPLNNSLLQYQYDQDWTRLSAQLADLAMRNQGDPSAGTTAVPVPSTREQKIKSQRYVGQGDEAFREQQYHRAFGLYKDAAQAARDNAEALFRAGYAAVALSRFTQAIDYFKRGIAVDPAMAAIGPTPSELYGDNNLAWNSHLGRVTLWVREDVRDAQRVLLMGMLLKFDGDPRANEFLEKAWQLSGGTEPVVATLLNPPKVEIVQPDAPAEQADDVVGQQSPAEGPVLGGAPPTGDAPSELPAGEGASSQPEIPAPPAAQPDGPSGRPLGEEPLFPLPSEQNQPNDEPIPPPLPAPTDE